MDVKALNEILLELQSKDISEVIQHIKEQLFHGKDFTATELEKITEYIKELKEHGIDTMEKTSVTIDNVLKKMI